MIMKPVVRIFQEIVANVKAEILSTIQANDIAVRNALKPEGDPEITASTITDINYQPAYLREVIETVKQMDGSEDGFSKIYPMVILIQQPEEHGQGNYRGKINVQIAICMKTEPGYKWDERYKRTFEPILYPIYESLRRKIAESFYFVIENGDKGIRHTKEDKPYWGVGGFQDAEGNILATPVDTILINNLSITLQSQKECN